MKLLKLKYWFLTGMMLFISVPSLKANSKYKTYITVAKDGSGDFTSIQKALQSCKSFPYKRITIYIKNGVYHEKVRVPSWNAKITMIGQSKDKTIITYDDYFKKINKGRNSTFYTATMLVRGNDFVAKNLTIKNSAGPVGQAIALYLLADRVTIINCRILGNQDTLYLSGENFRQYFKNCYIDGTTDFIFGEATAVFDDCEIKIKDNSYITAGSTPHGVKYGFVFKNCRLTAVKGVNNVFLGRTWRQYAKTVLLNCWLGPQIRPKGWYDWNNPKADRDSFYAEYHSKGPGANSKDRVSWSHQLSKSQVQQYTLKNIFRDWTPATQPNKK
ncbi:MAG TPA: pectinesterase family protein [Balneolales bacterium]|nr:pectinesterase family protein [Balneolales bacterium]